MGAAAALGLVPAALAGLGALRALRGAWRRPEPTSLFLIGLGVAAVLAYVYVNLRVPSYAQSKALYVSPALVVGIVAFAHGWDAIRARSRAAGSICVALLLLWAVLSAGAFRVGSDLAALRSRGEKALAAGDAELALEHFEAAAASAGEGWPRVGRCRALAMAGRSSAALSLCRAALAAEPDDADALFHTANLEARSGRPAAALELYEQLATLAPHDDRAHPKIAWLRAQLGDLEGARRAASEWLRFDPSNPTALAFATNGRAP
jgi:tetratricopeptide (TPR) repeat protein